jgi:hypothetical protein
LRSETARAGARQDGWLLNFVDRHPSTVSAAPPALHRTARARQRQRNDVLARNRLGHELLAGRYDAGVGAAPAACTPALSILWCRSLKGVERAGH